MVSEHARVVGFLCVLAFGLGVPVLIGIFSIRPALRKKNKPNTEWI